MLLQIGNLPRIAPAAHRDGGAKMLADVMPDGAWAGQRCFIIGGGPSLKGFDFSRLRGELVIGINRAYEYIDPAVLFTMDLRFTGWASRGELGANSREKSESREKFNALRATKTIIRNQEVPAGFCAIARANQSELTFSIESGFNNQNNSGFGALNLALCLGADPIYLLGFDMRGNADSGRQEWFHTGYPTVQPNYVYNDFLALFYRHANEINRRARVINCNPDSALRCFEFGDMPEARQRPLVVGFYTHGTGYETEAREMAASAHRMGLDGYLRAIDNRGWQRNTQFKAWFLRAMVARHQGRTIVYTDADSRFARYPALFDDAAFRGIRYHLHKGRELLSGTLQIHCDASTSKLMDLWVEECEKNPHIWDQQALASAVARWDGNRGELPKEYCCIFDSKPLPAAPVVVHYQASRRLKQEVGA